VESQLSWDNKSESGPLKREGKTTKVVLTKSYLILLCLQ